MSKLPKSSKKQQQQQQKKNCGLLHTALDWILLSDLESTLVIPPAISISQLKRNILLYSTSTKTVIILELICLCVENIESWHATKCLENYLEASRGSDIIWHLLVH